MDESVGGAVFGWTSIAKTLALTERTARRYAKRNVDPLPVYVYGRQIIADSGALKAWMRRNTVPLSHYVANGAKTP